MESDTISINKNNYQIVDMYDFDSTSFSTCINNTGMQGDFDIPIYRNFDISICGNFDISIYRNS